MPARENPEPLTLSPSCFPFDSTLHLCDWFLFGFVFSYSAVSCQIQSHASQQPPRASGSLTRPAPCQTTRSPPEPFSVCRHYPPTLLTPSEAESSIPAASEGFLALLECFKQLLSHHGSPWSSPPRSSPRCKPLHLRSHVAVGLTSTIFLILSLDFQQPPSSRCAVRQHPLSQHFSNSLLQGARASKETHGREEPRGQTGRDGRCRGRDGAGRAAK